MCSFVSINLDTLSEGIQKTAETLKYDLVPKQAFLCKHDNTPPHLALLAEEPLNCWTCELNSDISGPLKEEHKVWLPKKGNMQPCVFNVQLCAGVYYIPKFRINFKLV